MAYCSPGRHAKVHVGIVSKRTQLAWSISLAPLLTSRRLRQMGDIFFIFSRVEMIGATDIIIIITQLTLDTESA